MPRVEPASFLTLHYRGPQGDVINTFAGKPATLSLGTGELAPRSSSACWGWRRARARCSSSRPARRTASATPTSCSGWRASLNELGDPDEHYAVGDVVQFPTPGGQGS
jgi:FKBP-type peptidyl-prolyl cis-trans isomerase SlpA